MNTWNTTEALPKPKFNPTSKDLEKYVAEYLKNGGKITKLESEQISGHMIAFYNSRVAEPHTTLMVA